MDDAALNPNEVFREVTVRMCGSLDIDAAVRNTFPYLASLMPADIFSLNAFDPALRVVRTVATARAEGVPRELLTPRNVQLPPELARDMQLPLSNRADEDPAIRKILRSLGIHVPLSVLAIPLMRVEGLDGAVSLVALGHDRYEQRHIDLLKMLAVPFGIALNNAIQFQELARLRDRLAEDNLSLRRKLHERGDTPIGADMGLRRVMELVEQVAPIDSPVLLQGETGVGKEVIANCLHNLSHRRDRPLVNVNCGAIPETLVDSELFGHEKGSFTGAVAMRRGVFERADGGTIFLDEIGELPLPVQVKLLRVLQTMQVDRVGGTEPVRVDVRIVAATHRDLGEMVAQGRFREDLWYRLNVFPIQIPPLRERQEDVPLLAVHFAELHAREMNLQSPGFATGALEQLSEYDWPGNVRELRNEIERALILSGGRPLSFPNLGEHRRQGKRGTPAQSLRIKTLDEATSEHIRRALEATHGRLKGPGGAAALLGLPPSTLRNKMIRLGMTGGR